jgi:TRAP-type mannitol/chloroaromatic compound transport system permease small subunit
MPSPIRQFVAVITWINRQVFRLATALILIMVPVILIAVISRYVFNAPLEWAMELATLMFGPYFLLAGPYLLHTHGHVNLDLVQRAMGPRATRILSMINYPVIIAFCVILLFYAWPFAVQAWEYRETSFSSWNPPIWPVKFFIPLSLLLLGLQAIVEWLRMILDPSAALEETDHEAAS